MRGVPGMPEKGQSIWMLLRKLGKPAMTAIEVVAVDRFLCDLGCAKKTFFSRLEDKTCMISCQDCRSWLIQIFIQGFFVEIFFGPFSDNLLFIKIDDTQRIQQITEHCDEKKT